MLTFLPPPASPAACAWFRPHKTVLRRPSSVVTSGAGLTSTVVLTLLSRIGYFIQLPRLDHLLTPIHTQLHPAPCRFISLHQWISFLNDTFHWQMTLVIFLLKWSCHFSIRGSGIKLRHLLSCRFGIVVLDSVFFVFFQWHLHVSSSCLTGALTINANNIWDLSLGSHISC
jgi:hypothetical protein